MDQQTRSAGGRSPLGTLALLALSFALGYALGSRGDGGGGEWQDAASEPTEITIDGDEDGNGE
ncbi:hypothetical protein [Halorussus sp. AFM4]|uniref:hypothetical protein n=1 Tax=Halorussus sp. AFM4 TaxID=3421651 RepID=UPI003EBCD4D5